MHAIKLGPTAALVMRWARPLYTDERILKFLEQLDLSAADELSSRSAEDSLIRQETILNRKFFIRERILQALKGSKARRRVIILAAGRSPLALELLFGASDTVEKVYEVDTIGMEEKEELYAELYPELSKRIECLAADITHPEWKERIDNDSSAPSEIQDIVLIEGVSYYISRDQLEGIIRFFEGMNAMLLIEYAVPFDRVSPPQREVAERTFGSIQSMGGLNEIVCYTPEEMEGMLLGAGAKLIGDHSMVEMEFERTGRNQFFKEPYDGWARCVVGKMRKA